MDMNSLRHRLREAPFNFLTAVSSPFALQQFDTMWLSLREDVQGALQQSLLDDADISLAHSTASLLAVWGDLFLKTDEETAQRTSTLMNEVEDVFARLTISDGHPAPSLPRRSTSGSLPSCIPAAYSWMLQNIHNPYPSGVVKKRLSQDAGRPLRVITDWFKEVRRHIGWVSLYKDQFRGSRALAVQAAKCVYLQADLASQPSLSSDIVSQFEAIRTRLCCLYQSDDDGNLSDSTDDSLTPSMVSGRRTSDHSTYARSRSSSSTPSLVFSTDDEDDHSWASFTPDDPPMMLGKRKNITEENGLQPLKRNRSSFINVTDGLVTDVPLTVSAVLGSAIPGSPPPPHHTLSRKRRLSIAASSWEDTNSTISASLPICNPRVPVRVPKRRLSVSDSQPTSKRPCLPPAVGPRKQAVSTPIPVAYQATPDVDDWFRTFEMPDASLSVELFNWDVVVENDVFLYNSLFDSTLQSDGQDPSNRMPPSVAPTPLDLSVLSAVNPSVLDISSAFTEPPPTQSTASISTPPGPITATTTPVFDFLDAFLSAVNAEPHSTPSSSSLSTELSLNDTIDLFGESVVML